MSTFVRRYLLALQFFTRLPVTGRLADWVGFSPALLLASAAHFPGVGWLVGGLAAALPVAAEIDRGTGAGDQHEDGAGRCCRAGDLPSRKPPART